MDSRFDSLKHRLEELHVHLGRLHPSERENKRGEQEQQSNTPKQTKERNTRFKFSSSSDITTTNQKAKKKIEQQPRFQTAIAPSKSALKPQSQGDAATVSGLLARLREEEQRHVAERASLQLQVQKERQRARSAETTARRAEEQRDFRIREVRHLKAALQRRDDLIISLQDQIRELEVGISSAEAVQKAEAERDEMKEALEATREQLSQMESTADIAHQQAIEAKTLVDRMEREKNRAEAKLEHAVKDHARLAETLREERQVRAAAEATLSQVAKELARRQAQAQQLLAMAELLTPE